jgi:hypothetical protein
MLVKIGTALEMLAKIGTALVRRLLGRGQLAHRNF